MNQALSTHTEGLPPTTAIAATAALAPTTALALQRRLRFYDARASLYDFVVGSRLYHHLAWGMDPKEHEAFARSSLVASRGGPVLDGGCGSLLFTARCYQKADVPLTLLDASAGMLARGKRRLEKQGPSASPTEWVQGDLYAMPFSSASFHSAFHFGVLHCLDEPRRALAEFARVLRPGGQLFLSALVLCDRRGDPLLRRLYRSGHIAQPKTSAEVDSLLTETKMRIERSWQRGSFYFVCATHGQEPTP